MAVLIAELFAFAVVVYVVVRYVVPFARKTMKTQQAAVSRQVEDAEQAKQDLESAQARYEESLARSRDEAAQIRDRARADADYITVKVAERADQDDVRIRQRGEEQLVTQRQQTVRQLRREIGLLAVDLTGLVVRQALTEQPRRTASIDQMLSELEGMSEPERRSVPQGVRRLQAVSRDSLAGIAEEWNARFDSMESGTLEQLGDELYAVAGLLGRERAMLRHLADSSIAAGARTGLVDKTLGERLSAPTLDVLRKIVAARWSRPGDLRIAVEEVGLQALLHVAESAGELERVEDELFRFGRILDGDAELRGHLSDPSAALDRRLALLDAVLADKVSATTRRILHNGLGSSGGRAFQPVVEQLVATVATRRHRSIARITAPTPLSEEQETRLGAVLGRIYGREISLQVEVDEQLLGGLVVQVGDDMIDGSVAAQLDRARAGLPQ
ncbi:MAG: F0F1 ATP synthase subunit B/delta [Geodermatophilaceae bacterium]